MPAKMGSRANRTRGIHAISAFRNAAGSSTIVRSIGRMYDGADWMALRASTFSCAVSPSAEFMETVAAFPARSGRVGDEPVVELTLMCGPRNTCLPDGSRSCGADAATTK